MAGMLRFSECDQPVLSTDMARYSLSRKAADRNYSWAFIGGIRGHNERAEMINVFKQWGPYFHDAGLSPHEMMKQYNNSKFVLVGRGLINIGTVRLCCMYHFGLLVLL